jgi:hypothetical protein
MAIVGLLGMAALAGWSAIEYRERADPGLGGRLPIPALAGAAAHHADVCRIARRCAVPFETIRWFVVDADTLPTAVCPTGGHELAGCYEVDTRALTIVRRELANEVLLRHELMHAALAGGSVAAWHDCRYFTSRHRTWWAHMGCG